MRTVRECITSVQEKRRPVPHAPSWESLQKLGAQTMANTERTICELQDELSRMAGRVVDKDHILAQQPKDAKDFHRMYTLNEAEMLSMLREELPPSSSSGSSSTGGGSDNE